MKDFAGNFKKGYSAVEKLREVKGMEDETNKEATDLIKKESREEANKIMASITGEEKTFGIGLPFGISLPSGKTPENGYEEDESDNQ
uniref:Uncharacterized protein n=1 Tax=Candidatus Kentrum sp. LFY TaxID=2126342 RepID=A0A450UNC4_9GAMM|nr:MAG: hypothetical protein BECKLFY1418A_GA0070994_103623 [Candidatus Kentron sp. LFY]